MTVGMSAPPIGMISSTPNARARMMISGNRNANAAGIDDQRQAAQHGERQAAPRLLTF